MANFVPTTELFYNIDSVNMTSVLDETQTDTTPGASPLDKTDVGQLDSGISSAFLPPI